MRVLLMTIDAALGAQLRDELAQAGIVASMHEEQPDVIVVDDAVPEATACVHRLHADDADRPILVLASPNGLQMPPAGAMGLALKPLRPGELAVRVRLLVRTQRHLANPRSVIAATAVESAGDIIEITGPDHVYEYVNPAFVRTLGYTYEEVVGHTAAEILSNEQHDAEYFTKIDESLAATRDWNGLLIARTKTGRLVYLESAISPVVDDDGRLTHFVSVKRDITQRLRAENELRRINTELEHARDAALEASRAKSQFLANMSHELRTPLNAIIGYSEMLEEEAEELDNNLFAQDLSKIRGAGKHLLALINDVLDLSKIEAGAMKLYIEAFEVKTAISGVVATINPLIQERGNKLVVDLSADLGIMRADLTKLRQTLLNLLSNASKFTDHGRVELAVRDIEVEGQPYIEFVVRDTGIGMSQDQVTRLFRPFVQADASTTRKYGGTGLGLAISQRFCEMMGGRIEVQSVLDEGSTFRIVLPRVVDEPRRRSTEVVAIIDDDQPRPRVLVIDDDPTVQDIVGRALIRNGFEVEAATDGHRGLARAREHRPDAIVLDVMMPGLDGWSVLTALKGDPEVADIPVVMLTMIEQSEVGFALGAVDFLVKPVKTQRLTAVLRRHCRSESAHVLVIDDDANGREMARRTLEASGHRVTEANDGAEGIAALARAVPDIVLLDLMMPVMDGFAVLEHMRSNPRLQRVPVVVVTAKDLTAEDRQMLSGARAILERTAYTRRELTDIVAERVAEVLHQR
jgi:PAS domain S-box-containing protein